MIINNRSYRIIKERLLAGRHTDRFVGMDMNDPPIDFVAVAQGLGVHAFRVSSPSDIERAVRGACLVDDGLATSTIAQVVRITDEEWMIHALP